MTCKWARVWAGVSRETRSVPTQKVWASFRVKTRDSNAPHTVNSTTDPSIRYHHVRRQDPRPSLALQVSAVRNWMLATISLCLGNDVACVLVPFPVHDFRAFRLPSWPHRADSLFGTRSVCENARVRRRFADGHCACQIALDGGLLVRVASVVGIVQREILEGRKLALDAVEPGGIRRRRVQLDVVFRHPLQDILFQVRAGCPGQGATSPTRGSEGQPFKKPSHCFQVFWAVN